MSRYRVARTAMDQTGMGEKPVEDAKRRHGDHRVQGVLFTPARKLAMATTAKQAFEDRRLRIPAGRPDLRADLHKLKKITSETGVPRLIADRDGDGHADRAWAAFLGCEAAQGGADDYDYTPATAQSPPIPGRLSMTAPADDDDRFGGDDLHAPRGHLKSW